jgi:hypothetical protein
MTDFILEEYNRLETFEDRKAYCLKHQATRTPQPIPYLQWDYEKQNSYFNYELGE